MAAGKPRGGCGLPMLAGVLLTDWLGSEEFGRRVRCSVSMAILTFRDIVLLDITYEDEGAGGQRQFIPKGHLALPVPTELEQDASKSSPWSCHVRETR